MIVTKRVEGEVEFNDGEFAEIRTYGIEGIEKDLLLKLSRFAGKARRTGGHKR